ncbi:MAG TPA: NAD(P)H-dependent glycerol-3-phosphate dehydrogenase [Candidatus Binatia bacterium]|nr:NAD(P)H-dependent glycerol-3-phosphate dehydrogenase [Candidatus Binatia bacterium]
MLKPIGIIGAGGWGIALSKLLADKGEQVTLWCHGAESYRELLENRESHTYLAGIVLPSGIKFTRSIEAAVTDKSLIICAVPSHTMRGVIASASSYVSSQATVLCGTKGLEEESLKTMGEVLAEIFVGPRHQRHAFLSGPTFAVEVARGLPAAVTVAARLEEIARDIQETMSTQNFRVYTSTDVVGVQMGGVIKNIIAIAAGISDGLNLGHNARAALITRGLAEMTRLAVRMGADPMTLAGLPGLGDLVLTCAGDLSRNRQVGIQIAQGRSVQEISQKTRMVAEGIRNTRSVYLLARRLGAEMPIVEQMYQVIYEGKKPSEAVRDLMQRSLKPELS